MHARTVSQALAIGLSLCLFLPACGGTATSGSAEAQKTELTSAQITDAVFAAAPVTESDAFDTKIGAPENGKVVVTFGSPYGDFKYVVDVYTGEILEKTEPEEALKAKEQNPISSDATGLAMTACLDAYKTNGKESNVQVKSRTDDGVQKVRVQFDCEGKHYDLDYDVATGKITEYSAEAEAAADAKEASDEQAAVAEAAKKKAAEATANGTKKLSDDEATGMALDACWDLYATNGQPEDIVMEPYTDYANGDAQMVHVEFKLNGEHYDLIYNVATGEVTKR